MAELNAFLTISGMLSPTITALLYLVTPENNSMVSTFWCDSLWILSRGACAVIATRGTRSRCALAPLIQNPVVEQLMVPIPEEAIYEASGKVISSAAELVNSAKLPVIPAANGEEIQGMIIWEHSL